jgi:hypothetical protein
MAVLKHVTVKVIEETNQWGEVLIEEKLIPGEALLVTVDPRTNIIKIYELTATEQTIDGLIKTLKLARSY